MILDTSAIVAICLRERGWEDLVDEIVHTRPVGVGLPTLVESAIVLSARLGRDARPLLARLIQEARITTLELTEIHHAAAIRAWWRYGRGRHEARLDFGDCLSYAMAEVAGEPLLCVGDDFPRTDLDLA